MRDDNIARHVRSHTAKRTRAPEMIDKSKVVKAARGKRAVPRVVEDLPHFLEGVPHFVEGVFHFLKDVPRVAENS